MTGLCKLKKQPISEVRLDYFIWLASNLLYRHWGELCFFVCLFFLKKEFHYQCAIFHPLFHWVSKYLTLSHRCLSSRFKLKLMNLWTNNKKVSITKLLKRLKAAALHRLWETVDKYDVLCNVLKMVQEVEPIDFHQLHILKY